jgi:hypothetical protein
MEIPINIPRDTARVVAIRLERVSGSARSASLAWVRLALLLCVCSAGLRGDQRDPAFELYALAGGYLQGNEFPLADPWRPLLGLGVLVPLGRRWGVLFDVSTSSGADYWKWDGEPAPATISSGRAALRSFPPSYGCGAESVFRFTQASGPAGSTTGQATACASSLRGTSGAVPFWRTASRTGERPRPNSRCLACVWVASSPEPPYYGPRGLFLPAALHRPARLYRPRGGPRLAFLSRPASEDLKTFPSV